MLIRAWPVLTCSVCVVCHFLFSPLIGRAFSFFRSSFPTHGRCNWPGYCMRCILRWVPHCVPRCIPAKEIPTAWKAARIAHPSMRVPRGRALIFRVMALSFELTVLQKILYCHKSPNVCGPKQTGNDLCRSCWVLQGHSSEASVFDWGNYSKIAYLSGWWIVVQRLYPLYIPSISPYPHIPIIIMWNGWNDGNGGFKGCHSSWIVRSGYNLYRNGG